jgi:hypothetical protein
MLVSAGRRNRRRLAARQHRQRQHGEQTPGEEREHAQAAVEPPQRAELVAVDARHHVVLHRELGVQLAEAHLAPRPAIRLEVAQHDVLVVAQPLREVLRASLPRVGHVRAEAPRLERLDRLQEEEESDPGVDQQVETEKGPQPRRQHVDQLGARDEEEERDVERAHDHEREAGLAVGELHEVHRLLERVDERPIPLPRIERAGLFREELGLLLAALGVVVGDAFLRVGSRRRREVFDHSRQV